MNFNFSDPNEIRTRVTAVKGRCLNRLTMGPKRSGRHGLPLKNSPSRTRTYDSAVNSRVLYRLSYRGLLYHEDNPFGKAYTLKTTHCTYLSSVLISSFS